MFELNRRSILAYCASFGVISFRSISASSQENKMNTTVNEMPWTNAPTSTECNFALGHLVGNLPRRLTVDGRIHAETYISAVGAIAGYAAQRTLFADAPPVTGVNINRAGTTSGDQYWFGDTLNHMLVPKTSADANRCVWSLAAGSAVAAGIQPQQLPKLDGMFKHVSATIGGPNEGKSSVPTQHQAQKPARELLKIVWPLAAMCFSGKLPGASREFGAVPIPWWSAIGAQASTRPIHDVKSVMPPDIALTLLMETAIYCSKLDQATIEGT
jgi:hypothetical protein